jgi:hypothetical protein
MVFDPAQKSSSQKDIWFSDGIAPQFRNTFASLPLPIAVEIAVS